MGNDPWVCQLRSHLGGEYDVATANKLQQFLAKLPLFANGRDLLEVDEPIGIEDPYRIVLKTP